MEDTVPTLHDRAAFEKALAHYHVSEHAHKILASTPFVALSGIAGGGRNTVIRLLVQKYNFTFAISDTTRPPKFRDGRMEENGVDYYFRKEADMLHDIQNGEFIEAEVIHNQQVSGTSIREVERAKSTGRIPIHDFEYGGANNVATVKPDASIIGLVPPTYDEWIRRLHNREDLHEREFINRLETAEKVLENMLARPYFRLVVNDATEQCAEDIYNLVENNEYPADKEQRAHQVVRELLARVKQELQSRSI